MIVTLAVRVLQLLFAVVVLALSVVLIKDYGSGKSWSLIDYGAFCGGASIVIALVGVAACFMESLQGIIILALDGVASFFLLAGGIAYAATIKVGSCTDLDYLSDHKNPYSPSLDKIYPGVGDSTSKYQKAFLADYESRCRETQASTAFIWFLAACFVGTLALTFVNRGKRSTSIA